MRNKFIGGPIDGEVHLSFDLLTNESTRNSIPWEEYYNKGEAEPAADGEIPLMLWYHLGDAQVPVEEPKKSSRATTVSAEKSDLRARRDALKLSRQELADQAGVTVGVLARIETKGGTAEEVEAVTSALNTMESIAANDD